MNDYERGMMLVVQSLALKEGTTTTPVTPEAGRLWKDQDGVVRMYTGNEWIETGLEFKNEL